MPIQEPGGTELAEVHPWSGGLSQSLPPVLFEPTLGVDFTEAVVLHAGTPVPLGLAPGLPLAVLVGGVGF